MAFLRCIFLGKVILLLFGIFLINKSFLLKYKTTASDCFVDFIHDTHKYKNIFNKDIMKLEGNCDTADVIEGKQDLNGKPESANKSIKSNGQCHFISKHPNDDKCNFNEEYGFFEYPTVTRIEPGDIGDVKEINLKPGVTHRIITKSIIPPIFEIPSFFSPKECENIISKAKMNTMEVSGVVGMNISKDFDGNKSLADIGRVSQTSWVNRQLLGTSAWLKLRRRVSKLTKLPLDAIKRSETIQVVHYQPGGHYHAHLDTTGDDSYYGLTCCFQKDCTSIISTPEWYKCCRVCRYVTLVVYLNDVEEGGETAFPFANIDDATTQATIANGNWSADLSRHCHNASLLVKPEMGKAVFWYNHEVSDKGYIGPAINQTYHGGCDVIKGTKWIANFWIPWPKYENRFDKSVFFSEAV